MKILNAIEALLDWFYLVVELCELPERHLPVFKAFALILV
ncbi:hypothetical protein OUHCRE1_48050 [Enterobacter asburiae]